MGKIAGTRTAYSGEYHDYILEYDRKGQYRTRVKLPDNYSFRRVAGLGDDSFLAVAYERANSVPRLFVIGADGTITRSIELPPSISTDDILKTGTSGDLRDRIVAEMSLSQWAFAAARGRLLLYKAGLRSPVFEVTETGGTREVPIAYPDGYALDAIIPSDQRWLMRLRSTSTDQGASVLPKFAVYELSPSDGSLMRQIVVDQSWVFGLACDGNGELTSISSDPKGVILARAELAH
jgi:hypothetical protein